VSIVSLILDSSPMASAAATRRLAKCREAGTSPMKQPATSGRFSSPVYSPARSCCLCRPHCPHTRVRSPCLAFLAVVAEMLRAAPGSRFLFISLAPRTRPVVRRGQVGVIDLSVGNLLNLPKCFLPFSLQGAMVSGSVSSTWSPGSAKQEKGELLPRVGGKLTEVVGVLKHNTSRDGIRLPHPVELKPEAIFGANVSPHSRHLLYSQGRESQRETDSVKGRLHRLLHPGGRRLDVMRLPPTACELGWTT